MLRKHIFGFHKSEFIKCKLLINLEEKFIAGKNQMNSKKIISEAALAGVLKNFGIFTGKRLCWSLFFDKVAGFVTLSKKRL